MNRTNIAITLGLAAMLLPYALPTRVKTQSQRWIHQVEQADAPAIHGTNGIPDLLQSIHNLESIDLSDASPEVRAAMGDYLDALHERVDIYRTPILARLHAASDARCRDARRNLLNHINNGLGKPF